MIRKSAGFCWGLSLVVFVIFASGAAFGDSRVLIEKKTRPGSGVHQTHTIAEDKIIIKRLKGPNYTINYRRCIDPSHKTNGTPVGNNDIGVGLEIPTLSNWYYAKSFFIYTNGYNDRDDVTSEVPAQYYVADLPDRTLVTFVWDGRNVTANLTFAILAGRDDVFLDAKITPKKPLESLIASFFNFPSGFTQAWKASGDRWVAASSGKEFNVKCYADGDSWKSDPDVRGTLNVPDNSWIFFGDKLLDPAKKLGNGASGLFFLPDNITKCQLIVGGYFAKANLDLNTKGGDFRMALREFSGMPNDKSFKYMSEEWPAVREILTKNDFDINKALKQELTSTLAKMRKSLAGCSSSKLSPADAAKLSAYKSELEDIERIAGKADASLAELGASKDRSQALTKDVTAFGLSTLVN